MACMGIGGASCHEPASERKQRNLQMEMLQIVDNSLRLSRATFERGMTRIQRELSRMSALTPAGSGRVRQTRLTVSRTSFES